MQVGASGQADWIEDTDDRYGQVQVGWSGWHGALAYTRHNAASNTWAIRLQRIDENAQPLGSGVTVATLSGGVDDGPALGIDGTQDSLVLCYEAAGDVVCGSIPHDGDSWTLGSTIVDAQAPSVVYGVNGLILAYRSSSSVLTQPLTNTGLKDFQKAVLGPPVSGAPTSIAALSDGYFVASQAANMKPTGYRLNACVQFVGKPIELGGKQGALLADIDVAGAGRTAAVSWIDNGIGSPTLGNSVVAVVDEDDSVAGPLAVSESNDCRGQVSITRGASLFVAVWSDYGVLQGIGYNVVGPSNPTAPEYPPGQVWNTGFNDDFHDIVGIHSSFFLATTTLDSGSQPLGAVALVRLRCQ